MKDKASNKTLKKESGGRSQKRQWWKIAVFALGILLTAAAATYALTTRNSAASSGHLGNVPSIGSNTSQSAPATTGVGDLKWTQNLAAKFADHDFIFVILPENDSNSTSTLTKRVSDAAAKIEARGVRVETLTLSASDPELSITAGRLAIAQLPAVLAIGPSGNGVIMTGDITEEKLLQAYLAASQPVCPPGSSSGCCP
jgi:hypothetical protein